MNRHIQENNVDELYETFLISGNGSEYGELNVVFGLILLPNDTVLHGV